MEHTQPEKGRKLVIDIGGGSTELVIGEDFEPLLAESRRMGCVSFAQLFFPGGEISKNNFRRARLAAAQKLETLAWQYRIQGWQYALGASGTIKAAHEVLVAMGEKDGLITLDRLEMLAEQVLQFKSFSSLSLPGLSEDRQSVFVPGLAILCGVFDALAIRDLRLSDGALREGVLYEMEGRFRHQDIRSRTAKSLADHYNIDREQAKRVLETTELLYSQWMAQNTKLAHPQLEALLKWAAMLHEVGLSINHSGMHRHSAYILQNSNLPGFNQEQQLLLAALVRFHRKAIKLEELPRLNLFKKKHYLPLIQLLRLEHPAQQPASVDHHAGNAAPDHRRQPLDAALPGRLPGAEQPGAARFRTRAGLLERRRRLEAADRRRRLARRTALRLIPRPLPDRGFFFRPRPDNPKRNP